MALRITEESIDAMLFLTASAQDVDKDSSNTFKKVPMHYNFASMPPDLYEIFTRLYTTHLSPHLKTFGVLRSSLNEKAPRWDPQVEKFYDAAKEEIEAWIAAKIDTVREELKPVVELLPARLVAVSHHLSTLSPRSNTSLIPYVPQMLRDLVKVFQASSFQTLVVSHCPNRPRRT